MKSHTLRSSEESGADLSFSSPGRFDKTVQNILSTVYSSLPHFMATVDKNWLADIFKAPYQCSDSTDDRYDSASPPLKVFMIPQ